MMTRKRKRVVADKIEENALLTDEEKTREFMLDWLHSSSDEEKHSRLCASTLCTRECDINKALMGMSPHETYDFQFVDVDSPENYLELVQSVLRNRHRFSTARVQRVQRVVCPRMDQSCLRACEIMGSTGDRKMIWMAVDSKPEVMLHPGGSPLTLYLNPEDALTECNWMPKGVHQLFLCYVFLGPCPVVARSEHEGLVAWSDPSTTFVVRTDLVQRYQCRFEAQKLPRVLVTVSF
jgi:hypothetical protein